MPSSTAPSRDVKIQLIGDGTNNYGRLEPSTSEELTAEKPGLTKPNKWHPCHLYHYVFTHQDFIKTYNLILRILALLPIFTLLVSALEVSISLTASKTTRQSLNFDPCHKSEIYRFVSYMLIHANITHLSMNVLIQILLGTPMELEQGHIRAAAIYIGGGLGGSLGSSVIDPNTVVEGASAGVYAILMAQISHIVLNYSELRYKRTRLLAVAVLLLADITHASYHVFSSGNSRPRISLPAHISGAVTGILWGLLIFKGSSRWTVVIKIISGNILAILYGTATLYNLFNSPQCQD